jgi:hypothetical protein
MNKAEIGMIGILESAKKTTEIRVEDLVLTVKYPSMMETARIGVTRAKLLDGADNKSMDTFTDNLCYMLATLSVVTIKAPKDWNVFTLEDYEVLESLYEQYTQWVNSFRKPAEVSPNEGDSQPGGDEKVMGSDEGVQNTSK